MNPLALEEGEAKDRQHGVYAALALCFVLGVIVGMLSKL